LEFPEKYILGCDEKKSGESNQEDELMTIGNRARSSPSDESE
jgi:hypothetical protein